MKYYLIIFFPILLSGCIMDPPQGTGYIKPETTMAKSKPIKQQILAKEFLSIDNTKKIKSWFPSFGGLRKNKGEGYLKIKHVNGKIPELHEIQKLDMNKKGLSILGEAYDITNNSAASGVIIEVNEKRYRAQYGLKSPSLAKTLKTPFSKECGFKIWLPIKVFDQSISEVNIYVISSDKKSYYHYPAQFGLGK